MKVRFQDLIVYENDHYLVINKPPYMASLADRNDPANVQKLAKDFHFGLSVCHRLDKETSGCLLIARHPAAYRHASIQFEKRTIKKEYHALTHGLHEFRDLRVEAPVLALPNGIARIDRREGKQAITHFDTLAIYRHHTLISCQSITGRMHQIRVHLAAQGAPLVNDPSYKGELLYLSSLKRNFKLKKDTEEQPLIKRFALHASSLEFDNLEGMVKVEASYPKDFAVLVKQLKKNARPS